MSDLPAIPEIRFFIREEPYGFLSNFERTGFHARPRGIYSGDSIWAAEYWYPTNEHFYQAQKAATQEIHDDIVNLSKATLAMELGRRLEHSKHLQKYCKPHWEWGKLHVMLTGLRHKFRDTELRKMLLETFNCVLHEDNPDDPFWAIGDGSGASWLGKLLMVVREECRGWSCDDFGYMRCEGKLNGLHYGNCPMGEICSEFCEYQSRMAMKYE